MNGVSEYRNIVRNTSPALHNWRLPSARNRPLGARLPLNWRHNFLIVSFNFQPYFIKKFTRDNIHWKTIHSGGLIASTAKPRNQYLHIHILTVKTQHTPAQHEAHGRASPEFPFVAERVEGTRA